MSFKIDEKDALIIVDVQRDFCPEGALSIPEGDRVVPVLNEYSALFDSAQAHIFVTRDWHPPNHISFKSEGGEMASPLCKKDGRSEVSS